MGPGKVIFQDGRLVFVRHGSIYVRVSTNRVIKYGECKQDDAQGLGNNAMSDAQNSGSAGDVTDAQNSGSAGDVADDNKNNDSDLDLEIVEDACEKIVLKQNDIISYQMKDGDVWKTATVVGRAGKASGKYKHFYNMRDTESGEMTHIDMSGINDWHRCDVEEEQVEEVNVVLIPKNMQHDKQCMEVKKEELKKLK
jgi:hypothetical protein